MTAPWETNALFRRDGAVGTSAVSGTGAVDAEPERAPSRSLAPKLEKKKPPLRRGDYYYIPSEDGKVAPFVSVTTVLSEVAKPALVHWAARTAAQVALEDPHLSVTEAAGAIYSVNKTAKVRGSLVHSWVEAYTLGVAFDIDQLPESLKGYAKGFERWLGQTKPTIKFTEMTVINRTLGYAGTLDCIAEDASGHPFIIDYKTGGVYEEAAYQLSAYRHAEWAMDPVTREFHQMPATDYMQVVQLNADGTFASYEMGEHFTEFAAYLHLWRVRAKKECPSACFCRGV